MKVQRPLAFVLVASVFLIQYTTAVYYCTMTNTYGPCLALDAFPVLQDVLVKLSVEIDTGTKLPDNETEAIDVVKSKVTNLTDSLCHIAQPIINCFDSRNFTICDIEAKQNNTEAAAAITVYNSFRLINYGCTMWLSGFGNIEVDCPNYDRLFDPCQHYIPQVPLLKDFSEFFTDINGLFNLPTINTTEQCTQFKLRTGCVVKQFMQNCHSDRSYELPWWMARYQLDLGKPEICSFSSVDTASNLASNYAEQGKVNGNTANAQQSAAPDQILSKCLVFFSATLALTKLWQ